MTILLNNETNLISTTTTTTGHSVNDIHGAYCASNAECSYPNGECVANSCYCNQYIGGKNCSIPFSDVLGKRYQVFQLFFLVTIILVTLFTIFQTYKSFKVWKINKVAYKLKAVNHLFVLFFCFWRILYFAADPWGSSGAYPDAFRQFLYGFPIYILFTAYELLLIYWAGTFHNVQSVDSGSFFVKKTKPAFITTNSVWFAFEVIRVVLAAIRSYSFVSILTVVYNIYVFISCLAIMCGFIIYGALIYKRIQGLPTHKEKKKATLRKLLITTIFLSGSILCVMIPSIIFYFLKFFDDPLEALLAESIIHAIEIILIVELLIVMKPKESYNHSHHQQQQQQTKSPSSPIVSNNGASVGVDSPKS